MNVKCECRLCVIEVKQYVSNGRHSGIFILFRLHGLSILLVVYEHAHGVKTLNMGSGLNKKQI